MLNIDYCDSNFQWKFKFNFCLNRHNYSFVWIKIQFSFHLRTMWINSFAEFRWFITFVSSYSKSIKIIKIIHYLFFFIHLLGTSRFVIKWSLWSFMENTCFIIPLGNSFIWTFHFKTNFNAIWFWWSRYLSFNGEDKKWNVQMRVSN